jgi:hypothetical protein
MNKMTSIPEPCLINGQRVTREAWNEHIGILNCWELPKCDLLINFTDHLFFQECGMCHRQCENAWGNNGYPLTEKRICNKCNDKVIHARISCNLDRTFDPDCGEDSPDEPDNYE